MYDGRELFIRAPLVFVTAEIRLPYEPLVNQSAVRDGFGLAMRHRLPLLSTETTVSVQMTNGDATSDMLQQMRAMSEERTQSVTLSANALSIESVEYEHFEDFRRLIDVSLDALAAVLPEARTSRLGLRYINEVRAPNIASTRDWGGWISEELLAPTRILPNHNVEGLAGQLLLHLDEESRSLVRWGEVSGTTVLDPQSPLRVAQPEQSRFFVLDVDNFWEPATPSPVHKDQVLGRYDQLHEPAGRIFVSAMTENARRFFRGTR